MIKVERSSKRAGKPARQVTGKNFFRWARLFGSAARAKKLGKISEGTIEFLERLERQLEGQKYGALTPMLDEVDSEIYWKQLKAHENYDLALQRANKYERNYRKKNGKSLEGQDLETFLFYQKASQEWRKKANQAEEQLDDTLHSLYEQLRNALLEIEEDVWEAMLNRARKNRSTKIHRKKRIDVDIAVAGKLEELRGMCAGIMGVGELNWSDFMDYICSQEKRILQELRRKHKRYR